MAALASFTREGHIAGPLFDVNKQEFKVNPIMAIKKPGGHIRVVANLKYPPGRSFNDGIQVERLDDWIVTMTTSKDFAKKIIYAGGTPLWLVVISRTLIKWSL